LPLRVGLAFLPSQSPGNYANLDDPHKEQILERIRKRFADRKFVGAIVVIPDYYLKLSGGFDGLQEAQRDARVAGAKSFDAASAQMIANFDAALNSFETSVHEGRANVKVVNCNDTPTGGSGGGGGMGLLDALFLALIAALQRYKRFTELADLQSVTLYVTWPAYDWVR
jgi:hypothetical protein